MTIVEEINYKEPRNNNKSGGESTTSSSYGSSNTSSSANSKRERSVDSSLRKIPAKVLLDMLKTENDAKSSAYDTSKGMELLTIQSSLGRKLAMEMDFFNKSNEASMLKDELTSLSRLKESNKVREIINSFNNFEKNNDFNAKKKYLSKYNTINISNLGKPPPPVKKFNNPNNKMRPNPETAASAAAANTSPTIIEIHDKRSGETSSSLSFHLNTSESKAEKRLMKQQANMAAFNDKNKKSTTHTNNPIVLINSSITSKNLLNTENLLSKITDSIIKSDSPSINNDINIINTKLAKIVNMLNNDGSSSSLLSGGGQLVKLKKPDNLKVLEIGQQHQNMSDLSNEGSNIQPPPVLNPTRKRTFANMVWPMDPEEEKILRSCSPYEVPEVIVQRNDSVKSILKKNNFLQQSYNNSSSPAYEQSSPNPDTAGSKKRVDFHENCCFINFFEIQDDDFVTTSS